MSGMSTWFLIAASAASIGSAAAPGRQQQPVVVTPVLAGAVQSSAYSWDTYKVRLAALARLQGVRESTIQANVPGLTINQSVIDLERTEPVAHSVGGVVGVLAPYLRAHVTPSLISRGRANYSEHFNALSRMYARYGVDPAILMSIWGM